MFQPCTVTAPKPRICHLLLYSSLLNPPFHLLLLSNVLPGGQYTPDPPPHSPTYSLLIHDIICPPGPHLYPSHHTKKSSPPPSPIAFRVRLLPLSLTPATPSGLPLPPLPCFRQNIFYRGPQLFFICRLPPPRIPKPPPSLGTRILCACVKKT